MNTNIITDINLPNLRLVKQGKVRNIYEAGDNLAIVVSDRISAFDIIMDDGIPDKGRVLTQISRFWFDFTKDIVKNHMISTDIKDFPSEYLQYSEELEGRSMLVKKVDIVPIECIVRGYITGSGWNDYKKTGCVSGIKLPSGLVESEKLPEPLFTPSTKAELGEHDENITQQAAREIAGGEVFEKIKNAALDIYNKASEYALGKGIIIADTKMEFGICDGEVVLADELLTPDSSRFWDLASYEKGKVQASYDKQYLRDYLLSINFGKQPPAPRLPDEIIKNTQSKYLEALEKLTS